MPAGPRPLSSREPDEYREATDRARAVRAQVAEQVRRQIIDADITGGQGLTAVRLQELSVALRSGERDAVRSAVMELTISGGAWLAAIDLGQRQAITPQRHAAAA
jgi:hypothetical protein